MNLAKSRTAILVILVVAGLGQAWIFHDHNLSISGDNATYMALGTSLARGNGYVHISHPDMPAQTKFPPGFPALLAVVCHLAHADLPPMKWFVSLLYALSIPLIFLLISTQDSRAMAFAVALFCLVSNPLLEYSHMVMSEIPYMVFSLITLLLSQRRDSLILSAGVVISAVSACYIRSVGLTVIVTVVAVMAAKGRYKNAAASCVASALLLLPWHLYTSSQGGGVYLKALLSVNPYRLELGFLTPYSLVGRVFYNLKLYGFQVMPEILLPYPFQRHIHPSGYPILLWLPASICFLSVCYFMVFHRGGSAVRLYLAIYMGGIILWPSVWSDMRFMVPVIPLVFYAAAWSVRDLGGRIGGGTTPRFHDRSGVLYRFVRIQRGRRSATFLQKAQAHAGVGQLLQGGPMGEGARRSRRCRGLQEVRAVLHYVQQVCCPLPVWRSEGSAGWI